MRYRQLGASGLRVSVLTMGTMTFGGTGGFASVGSTGVEEARGQVDRCLDAGVNLIDTANVYSGGLSEEILGQVLEGRRDGCWSPPRRGCRWATGPTTPGCRATTSSAGARPACGGCGTDRIDLYQVHEWDGQTPLEETLEALDDLVRAGKVRYVGCSNYAGWQLMKALGIAERQGLGRFVSQQIHYTLQAREAEYELVPISIDQGLGMLVWSPLAGGLLSGKYRRDQPRPRAVPAAVGLGRAARSATRTGSTTSSTSWSRWPRIAGASPAQVALAWLLARPAVTSVIVGARTSEQLADNLGAADLTLSKVELARLEEVSRAAAAVSLLASGQDRCRSARPGRPLTARPPPGRVTRPSYP